MKVFAMMVLSLTLVACDRQESPSSNADNTGINVRDRDSMTKTPMDQSENENDRLITQKVRQAVVSDNTVSMNGKNIKIITVQGVVTLRGPVDSAQEKDAIARKVKDVQGVQRVDNQLDVAK